MQPRSNESPLYAMAGLAEALERHRPRLEQIFTRRLHATTLAQSVDVLLQESVLDAVRKWPKRRPDTDSEFVWFYGIVHDQMIEMFRSLGRNGRNRQNIPLCPDTSFQFVANLAAGSSTPSRKVMQEELVELVQDALTRLADDERLIVEMHTFDGLTFVEIAAHFGRKVDAVRKRYVRALARLGEVLADQLGSARP